MPRVTKENAEIPDQSSLFSIGTIRTMNTPTKGKSKSEYLKQNPIAAHRIKTCVGCPVQRPDGMKGACHVCGNRTNWTCIGCGLHFCVTAKSQDLITSVKKYASLDTEERKEQKVKYAEKHMDVIREFEFPLAAIKESNKTEWDNTTDIVFKKSCLFLGHRDAILARRESLIKKCSFE